MTLCNAPWTSLHLDPQGWATVCTANKRDPLGHVGDHPLVDLWRDRSRSLRRHFGDGGLAPGCDVCRWQREGAGASTMYARIYDHLEVTEEPDWPQHIEFTLSNDCNLACVMCSGSFSSTIRRRREGLAPLESAYDDAFFEQLPPFLDHVRTTKVLGGEPFLAAENFRVWDLLAASPNTPNCHITTNGTVFTRRVAEVLERVPMSFAVSIDGMNRATVEQIRSGAKHADILAKLDRFQRHADDNGTDLSLTFCLMTENWQELAPFLEFGEQRGLPVYVNTVLSPSRFSLYLLPPDELRQVVEELDAIEARVSRTLDRNRATWHDHLHRLRQALVDPISDQEVPVHFPALRTPPKVPVPRPPAPAAAESLLREWSKTDDVAILEVAASGRIEAAEPLPGIGPQLDRLVGQGIDEVFIWLQSAYGRLDSTQYLVHADDGGDRILRFEGRESWTEVRSISGRQDDGSAWWRLAARSMPTGRAPRPRMVGGAAGIRVELGDC